MRLWQMLALLRRRHSVEAKQDPAHISEEDLERFALSKVEDQEHVTIESHLRGCETCQVRLQAAHQFVRRLQELRHSQSRRRTEERRKDLRYRLREAAVMSVSHPQQFQPINCTVVDVSSSGIRLSSPQAITPGSELRVQVQHAVVFGKVCYCQPNAREGFDLGIQIDQVVMSSTARGAVGLLGAAVDAKRHGTGSVRPAHAGQRRGSTEFEVLLVEDNPGDIMLTRMMFSDLPVPHHLTVVTDGEEALEHLLDPNLPKPSLVLLDLALPRVSGFRVLEVVRGLETLQSLTIAVLSCSASDTDMRRTRELGVRAYFLKPSDFHEYAQLGTQIEAIINDLSV